MMTFGFQVVKKNVFGSCDMSINFLSLADNIYTFSQELQYSQTVTRPEHCKCFLYTVRTFTWHTEQQTLNSGSLNNKQQFHFSSVRPKFKTSTSINLVSMIMTQDTTSLVLVYLFNEAIKLSISNSY